MKVCLDIYPEGDNSRNGGGIDMSPGTCAPLAFEGFMVGNQASGFHHVDEPAWHYQVKSKFFAGGQVGHQTFPQVNLYVIPGIESLGNFRQVNGWTAKVPGISEIYPVY